MNLRWRTPHVETENEESDFRRLAALHPAVVVAAVEAAPLWSAPLHGEHPVGWTESRR